MAKFTKKFEAEWKEIRNERIQAFAFVAAITGVVTVLYLIATYAA